MRNLTKTIAGVPLTLVEGIRYRASRPFSTRGRTLYPVTIERLDDPVRDVMTIDRLSYDAANDLVNAFNNGPTTFDGRVWTRGFVIRVRVSGGLTGTRASLLKADGQVRTFDTKDEAEAAAVEYRVSMNAGSTGARYDAEVVSE